MRNECVGPLSTDSRTPRKSPHGQIRPINVERIGGLRKLRVLVREWGQTKIKMAIDHAISQTINSRDFLKKMVRAFHPALYLG